MKSAMQQPPQCSQGLPTAKPKLQIVGDNDEGQRYIDPFQGKVNKDYSDLLHLPYQGETRRAMHKRKGESMSNKSSEREKILY